VEQLRNDSFLPCRTWMFLLLSSLAFYGPNLVAAAARDQSATLLAGRLGVNGLRFLLARALAPGRLSQRLATLLPVLVLTAMLPNTPSDAQAWLGLLGFLVGWLALHWFFELRVDRQAAQAVGSRAEEGLREVLAASAAPLGWLSVRGPPSACDCTWWLVPDDSPCL
jgi:hypothetical protein